MNGQIKWLLNTILIPWTPPSFPTPGIDFPEINNSFPDNLFHKLTSNIVCSENYLQTQQFHWKHFKLIEFPWIKVNTNTASRNFWPLRPSDTVFCASTSSLLEKSISALKPRRLTLAPTRESNLNQATVIMLHKLDCIHFDNISATRRTNTLSLLITCQIGGHKVAHESAIAVNFQLHHEKNVFRSRKSENWQHFGHFCLRVLIDVAN